MTAKTTHKKAKAKFDYPKVKARLKKQYRKKFKKKISLTEIDEIWKTYLEESVVKKLLQGKKVEVIRGFDIEVVGRRIENTKSKHLHYKGLKIMGNKVVKHDGFNQMKKGFSYKIECHNSNFKGGKLYFKANAKIRNRLSKLLSNTGQYFRIEQNESK